MKTKLTLEINKAFVENAKRYAEKQGQSLSVLVETFFSKIPEEKPKSDKTGALKPLPKSFQRLEGIIKYDKDFDYKEELTKALIEKHGV